MSTVQTLQDTIAGVADSVGPSVVGLGRGWGHGSGVVIADGQILTSAHNLRREEVTVSFHDGRRERAELVGLRRVDRPSAGRAPQACLDRGAAQGMAHRLGVRGSA